MGRLVGRSRGRALVGALSGRFLRRGSVAPVLVYFLDPAKACVSIRRCAIAVKNLARAKSRVCPAQFARDRSKNVPSAESVVARSCLYALVVAGRGPRARRFLRADSAGRDRSRGAAPLPCQSATDLLLRPG